MISFCIYLFMFFCKGTLSLKRIAKLFVSIICYILCLVILSWFSVLYINNVVVLNDYDKKKVVQIQRNELPYGWGLFLGLNLEHPGEWNRTDADIYYRYQEIEDENEAKQYQIIVNDNNNFT